MSEQKPDVGRVVHYVNINGTHCAATIARVNEDNTLNLGVLDPIGQNYGAIEIRHDESYGLQTWHWPEHV